MSPIPQISVAIVNWNTGELLRQCLFALERGAGGLRLEIIVVDNASTDGSADRVRKEFPGVRWVQNSVNLGFAAATNQALRLGRAEYCLLLNPDTEVRPDALRVLWGDLLAHPEASAVGPQLLNSDRSLQPSGRRFPTLGRVFWEGFLPELCTRTRIWKQWVFGRLDFSRPAEVDEVSGACFLTRKKTMEDVGFLDERFFMDFEEVDWFLRAAQKGYRARYQPLARVVHHWGAGVRQTRWAGLRRHCQSEFVFWEKHRGVGGRLAVRWLRGAQSLVRLLFWLACGWLVPRQWPRRVTRQAVILASALGWKGGDA